MFVLQSSEFLSPEMSQAPQTQDATFAPADGAGDLLAFPASIAQQVFWYLELLQPGVTAFNIPMRFRLEGPLDLKLLERTLATIIERHESLRTRFEEDDGELLQIVEPFRDFTLPLLDVSHLPEGERQAEADRLGSIEAQRPFCLATGPAFRAELVRLSPTLHILHVTVHHALFDGSSMTVLTEELAKIYQAYFEGRDCPLDPPPIQYGDFSVWQKDFLAGPEIAKQLAYWRQRLQGMAELDLPTDRPRPAAKTWNGELISALLPKELTQRLQAIAAREGATLYHLLLAAYKVLLHRYSGGTDIAVGSPITGRTRGELEPLIGVFINSLILRSDLSGDPSFESLVRQVRDTALAAVENQDLPFECLVRDLKPARDPSRNPLFQVNFTHQRSFAKAGRFGGVELIPIPSRSPGAIFDLHFFMVERAEGWRVTCDYSSDLFDRSTAERMLGHYRQLLENIADDPTTPLSKLDILTPAEKEQLVVWSGNRTDYPHDSNIAALFLETARVHPQRTALEFGKLTFTYDQLLAEASAIASRLSATGLASGELVALSAKPSPEMIAGLLGIVLAGGAYVPLDPAYPAERFALLLEESGARIALAADACGECFGAWSGTVLDIPAAGNASPFNGIPEVAIRAEDPAYLLFTSGSTGKPKGVLVPHRGVVRLVHNCDFIDITPDDVFLQAAPLSFDASTLEIWGPLLNGGKLVIPAGGTGLDEIASAVRDKGVTTLWLTAGLFQVMVEEHLESLKGLRYLLAGGDVLSVPHVRRAFDGLPGTALINGYGPTENTTFTTCHRITAEDCERASIPIGRPIANTTVQILDEQGRTVPIGIPGELFTGGDGLALRYHNDPELTAERFVTFSNAPFYKTGDLCRWLPDGTIEFVGRRDHQVKVRGFRIELGEIESVLASHPEIRQSKVAVRGDSSETKRILAWVLPEQGSLLDAPALSAWLEARLPAYLRPDGVALVDVFPVTANGKIDVAALPDPARKAAEAKAYSAPEGETEQKLAALWSELLQVPEIGRDDDFFTLGGHSLLALRLFSRINREFGRTLPLAALLGHPTISKLAALLCPQAEAGLPDGAGKGHLVTLSESGDGTPLFCLHGGDGGVLFYRSLAELMPQRFPLHAIESLDLSSNGPITPASVEETAAAYVENLLSVHPGGPFRLAGYSFGGVVAHEMACILQERGHTVEFLGLFDTHNPTAPAKRYSLTGRFNAFWQQQHDLPLPSRLERLRERIAEGIATNRRVKAEVAAALGSGPAEAHSDLRRVQVREENWRAMQAYRPRRFNGKITLFKAMTASDKVEWPEDYGWTELAGEGLEIVPVPGRHLTLFDDGNVVALAQALASKL
jgi:amino acid adenylation domain-containing protein